MRDPQRIERLLGLIGQIWEKNSDLRFLQLVYSLQSEYSQKHNNIGKVENVDKDGYAKIGFDLFIEYLRERIKNGL